ncbi:MAG: trypsin-like peptidase domain-containing protein [Planctomycetes bacterium]|nr:trypsin-like peptidase domain-containing protein [Planctomycetota bacterium]MBZ0151384.1 trypsin-like peptidase domain-containing protein [Planctomycetota bacterium]MCC7399311.1 trypsin-like peptidase domain-containing protein [Planctomycetota bacterium]
MRPQLLHLSGPQRGRTITYPGPVVRIGSAADRDAVITAPGVAPKHAQIEWVQDQCRFHLRRRDGQVFVNGNEVEEVILDDEDQIELGEGGPMLRFRIYVPQGAVCKPVHRMLSDARDVARTSGGGAAAHTWTLTRDLLTQATLRLKIGFPLALVGGAFLAGWLGGWLGTRDLEAEQRRTANMVTQQELANLRDQQQQQRDEVERLVRGNSVARRIQKDWSRGVCLVHGVFRLRRTDGAWFTVRGQAFEEEYTGSGFRVTESGHVVTNRHVLRPWLEDENIMGVIGTGVTPEFVHLSATFPGKQPIDIAPESVVLRQDELDVAVFQIPGPLLEGIPVLPLHLSPAEEEDQRAYVVGYPTGIAALLARADNKMLEGLRSRAATLSDAIDELARAGQIAPVITNGIVSNWQPNVVAYSAETTHGGSGGPVFGADGEVIAVNYAIQREFGGNNLGVPIRFAAELLPK